MSTLKVENVVYAPSRPVPTTVTTDDDASSGSRLERDVEGQFEIGGVLVGRMATDLAVAERGEHLRIDRVEIPDRDVDLETERPGMFDPRVGADHQQLVTVR